MIKFARIGTNNFGRKFSSSAKEIKKVAVVGLGLMGHGVAQISAQSGYEVVAVENNASALEIGNKRIKDSLSKVVARNMKKGSMSADEGEAYTAEVLGRITSTTKLGDVADCDLVVEAIAENVDLKLGFYKELGGILKEGGIAASNTSSLQITPMGEAFGRPKDFVGLHFFNPVQMMKLCEVIHTDSSDPAVFEATRTWAQRIGKTTVSCSDTPGFVVNRLLVPYLAQAMAMVDRKVASVPDIDVSMQLGAGHPMGPLHLADYIGLDTCLSILVGKLSNLLLYAVFISLL
jgi:3-hydroxyacyl-CoA dehydrogenase